MPFAAALSEHPVAADAIGEALGEVLEQGGRMPDLAVLFASDAHAEFLGEFMSAVHAVLQPGVLIGASASAVIGGGREAEDRPALSLWAAWTAPVSSVRITTLPTPDGFDGVPTELPEGSTLLVLADPFSFPMESFVDAMARSHPGVTVVGGLASAASGPGGNALLLDDSVHRDGAIGVVLPREHLVGPVVSQGCRPIGDPMVVTAIDGNVLVELAGRPALERLTDLAGSLEPAERTLLAGGIHLGMVIDERRDDFGPGDFLVRGIIGGDREKGVLAVGARVEVGTTVQFHVRDAASADADLGRSLEGVTGDAALLFTCTGRGRSFFGVDDHDAAAVSEHLDTRSVAGMFCAGEVGPVGGRSFVHGFTASVLVFADD